MLAADQHITHACLQVNCCYRPQASTAEPDFFFPRTWIPAWPMWMEMTSRMVAGLGLRNGKAGRLYKEG